MKEGQIKFVESTHEYSSIEKGKKVIWISCTTFIGKFKDKFEESSEFWAHYKVVQDMLGMSSNDEEEQEKLKKEFSKLMISKGLSFKEKSLAQLEKVASKLVRWEMVKQRVEGKFKQWDETRNDACEVGTEFHEYKEEEAFRKGALEMNGRMVNFNDSGTYNKDAKLEKYSGELTGLNGAKVELLIYLKSVKLIVEGKEEEIDVYLCGQVDKCNFRQVEFTRGIVDTYVDIDDYKTNKEIELENPFQKMKEPISHLDDCNYNHYALQISLYAYMLEQKGYKIGTLSITHHDIKKKGMKKKLNDLVGTENKRVIFVPYLKDEIEKMILFYFKQVTVVKEPSPLDLIFSKLKK